MKICGRFFAFIKSTLAKATHHVSCSPSLVIDAVKPQEEKWNPCQWRGVKWVILRQTPTGLHAEILYELDRNKEGRVTLIQTYGWDKVNKVIKNSGHWTTIERNISDLNTEAQAVDKLLKSEKVHPAVGTMLRYV